MAHHGLEHLPDELKNRLSEEVENEKAENAAANALPDFGATGRYPEGKLAESDRGEIRLGVAAAKGRVIMHFGDEMGWIGMLPRQAQKLARSLSQKAREARQQKD